MGEEEKKKFLVFLTGSSRVPIGGLEVNIKFVNVSPEHLPVAHTCFNLLDLPVSFYLNGPLIAPLHDSEFGANDHGEDALHFIYFLALYEYEEDHS